MSDTQILLYLMGSIIAWGASILVIPRFKYYENIPTYEKLAMSFGSAALSFLGVLIWIGAYLTLEAQKKK